MTDLRVPSRANHRRSVHRRHGADGIRQRWSPACSLILMLAGLLIGAGLGGIWVLTVGASVPPWWVVVIGASVAFAMVTVLDNRTRTE